jgi:hypothetical protein
MKLKNHNSNLLPYLAMLVLLVVVIFQEMVIYTYFDGRDVYSLIARGNHFLLNKEQIDDLKLQIVKNTPEYTHFEPGAKFDWVFLQVDSLSVQKELYDTIVQEFKKRYTVYLAKENIPIEHINKSENGYLMGYNNGFRFSYRCEFLNRNKLRIHYDDYEGCLAASGFWIIYKWNGKKWKIVKKGPMWVS